MSGVGAADTTLNPEDYKGFKLAIVAASWHTQVMDGLINGAKRAAYAAGIEPTLVRVPGTFELPVAATRLAEKFDAIVALGVVIRGGTPHFDYVCQGATNGLTDVSVLTGRPIGFGVLTCDNEQQHSTVQDWKALTKIRATRRPQRHCRPQQPSSSSATNAAERYAAQFHEENY